jgi:hypothetical protein
VGGQRRPDQFGFILLALIGAWAVVRRVDPLRLALIGGLLLGGSTLLSEASPMIVCPWLVLVVVAAARTRGWSTARLWLVAFVSAAPSILVLAATVVGGRVSVDTVAALQSSAPLEIADHGSVFVYLGDDFRSSIQRVVDQPILGMSIVVGAVIAALMYCCTRRVVPHALATFRWVLPTARLRRVWGVATVVSAAALFALGFDWLRWITSIGFAALLAGAAVVMLLGDGAALEAPERAVWTRPVPARASASAADLVKFAIAVYLLVLAPLPNFIRNPADAVQTLLNVAR